MRSLRSVLALFVVTTGLAVSGAATTLAVGGSVAYADSPTPCHSDTTQPRTYTHGSPITGLVSRHGYYYLDVKLGPGCGVGADGRVHLVAYVHALQIVPAVGDTAHGYVPDNTHHAVYWLEYHGANSSGGQYTLGLTGASPYVTSRDHLDAPCYPDSRSTPQVCQDGPGTSRLTLRYDGPDVFGLAGGADARFRIANESGVIITDFAQLDVVACATCVPSVVG